MKPVRTFFAVLIIIFIALPILFGITWAVGLTRAVVSPDFISRMPQEMIRETRGILDEMVRLGPTDDPSLDADSRAWLRAMASVGQTPGEVLDASGVSDWLQNELNQSLQKISDILRGNIPAAPVELNMIPLKQALQSPAMRTWVHGVLSNLPECGPDGVEAWRRFLASSWSREELPSCRPAAEITDNAVNMALDRAVADIPDRVEMMNDIEIHPRGINIARTLSSVTFIMFLIPALFIFLAALLAASSRSSFFRWAGITTMIGGGLALVSAMAARNAADWGAWIPRLDTGHFYTPMESMIWERMGGLWNVVGDHLVQPVIEVAGAVCVVGLVVFALAYAFHSAPPARNRSAAEPAVPRPSDEKTRESRSLPE